jgi:hypothetical protein
MFFGHRFEWVFLAGICVLAMALFPAPSHQAPFNAVYGPTTDLRSSVDVAQALPLLLAAMIVARVLAPIAPAHSERIQRDSSIEHSLAPPPLSTVLRC